MVEYSMRKVEELTRIEGEGRFVLYVDDKGIVQDVEYVFIEPRRFFEHLVRGLHYTQIPDLVSRICGLCGVSYVLGAVRAFERCLGLSIPDYVEKAREIVHLSERVKSHLIHTVFMALPEILGVKSYIEISKMKPDLHRHLVRSLVFTERLVKLAMGRLHNAVNIHVGGVNMESSRLSSLIALAKHELLPELATLITRILEATEILVNGDLGDSLTCSVVSEDYPGSGTRVLVNGFVYDAFEFYEKVVERKMKQGDNTYRYLYGGRAFLTGPLARFNRYRGVLMDETRELLETYGWYRDLSSPFQSIIARLAEAYDSLHRIIYYASLLPDQVTYRSVLKEGSSFSDCYYVIEAPRGVLYQRFRIDSNGLVIDACIIPPTAQNAEYMERYTRRHVIGLREDEAVRVARVSAVMFDPCLPCSVHSLKISKR